MSKEKSSTKETKKKALLTPKEKRRRSELQNLKRTS